jgi:hypothetical protein
VQFPVETVREVAQLLNDANLGEISLENTATGAKISLKRAVYNPAPQTQAEIEEAIEEAEAIAVADQIQATASAQISVAPPRSHSKSAMKSVKKPCLVPWKP